MPPKARFTREEITEAALTIVNEKGIEALTARELAKQLGVTTRPIFTAFENMEDVHRQVRAKAKEIFDRYTGDFKQYSPAFKRYGMQMISFAQQKPRLFQLLFMQKESVSISFIDALSDVIGDYDRVLAVMQSDYKLTREQSNRVFNHLWISAYGICVLIAQKVCVFSEAEVSRMLSETFLGVISAVRSDDLESYLQKTTVEKV